MTPYQLRTWLESQANPTHMTFCKKDAAEALAAFNRMMSARDVAAEVCDEIDRARGNWPNFYNAHEGYAVLLEEVDELKAHVWTKQRNRDLPAMRKEAIQVAAMAIRFAEEVCDEERGRK